MKTPFVLTFLLWVFTAQAQQHPRDGGGTTRRNLFAADAHALPGLYEKRDFDSIGYFIQLRWREPTDPDVFCQAILLSIQRNIFDRTEFPDLNSLTWPMVLQLSTYADVLAACQDISCHRSAAEKDLFFTTSRWAYDLRSGRRLDSVEDFLCRVFSGDIRYPADYLSIHSVAGEPGSNGVYGPRPYRPHRLGLVLTFSSGIWMPNGNLSLLGIHPSINYGIGVRNSHNEWDLDVALRFGNTPTPYTLLRNGILISRTFYNGENFSYNYTRYLIHHPRWESGLSTGVGVDYIYFASGTDNPDWSPTEISCFDFNLGLRYNYFFGRRGFVGVIGRYHFLSYSNPGGSPFDGNAATIDVIIGLAGEYKH